MNTDRYLYIACILAVTLVLGQSKASFAVDGNNVSQTGWDNTVNSLLATGMYGIGDSQKTGLAIQFQNAQDLYKGLSPDQATLNGHAITFSYDGSSGLLEFSAGYIYANEQQGEGTVFLGIDPVEYQRFNPTRSWYMAFDLSGSYAYDENINFGFGSKTMLMKNPFETEEGKLFSILFNMPISYKSYITITPQVQWSRTLPADEEHISSSPESDKDDIGENIFYGGVSVSFSY
ncbi:hypothetical protein [Desulfogranum japonicum]|uniref:hypothetical protein n=1 Tax=Desulfogranum japonicum TaxID=231447 RepID=UPI00048C6083|nr:hypothetical protein [Desulfogranum japonicum]